MPKHLDSKSERVLGLHWGVWLIILTAACIVFAFGTSRKAHSQHRHGHAQFHAFYQEWVNGASKGCCNDKDCRPLSESHERQVAGGELEVFVTGVGVAQGRSAWCRVQPHHYLSKGNAPNWATAHVCVTDFHGGTTPCEQFICYQPRPQI